MEIGHGFGIFQMLKKTGGAALVDDSELSMHVSHAPVARRQLLGSRQGFLLGWFWFDFFSIIMLHYIVKKEAKILFF